MGFGDRLKMVRKELGLTQQEMADRMRIKRSCLANYETDRNFPIDAVIGLICQEFGTNEEWLRTGDGGKKNMFVKHNTTGRYLANLKNCEMPIAKSFEEWLMRLPKVALQSWKESTHS